MIKNSYVDGEDDYQDAVSGVRAPVFDTVSTTSVVHSAVSGVARLKCSVLNLGDKTVTVLLQLFFKKRNALAFKFLHELWSIYDYYQNVP